MSRSLLVVGGGVGGLAAAYMAAKQGAQVTIVEGAPRVGGLLQTFETSGGGRAEFFYHHHFRADAEFQWLLRELGIADKLRFYPTTMGVYRAGVHYPFNGPADLLKFKPMSFFDKLRFGFTSLYLAKFCDWRKCEGVTCREWFGRHAGKTTSESLWAPMLKVKFGDYAGEVPLSWMVGRMKQRLASRKGSQETLGYLDGSLETLLRALEEKLAALGVVMRTGVEVTGLALEGGQVRGVETTMGPLAADAVLFTTPSEVLRKLVGRHDAAYAEALGKIEYFGALCVVVETTRALSGTYWLNVADPGFPFGGVIEHTNLVPKENFGGRHLTYLSRYFELGNPIAKKSDSEVIEEFLPALKRLYPTLEEDEIVKVRLFRTRTGAVVCDRDFSRKVPPFRAPLEGLFLASMCHLYPDERSVNNAIRVAANALGAMGYDTREVPQGTSLAGVLG